MVVLVDVAAQAVRALYHSANGYTRPLVRDDASGGP